MQVSKIRVMWPQAKEYQQQQEGGKYKEWSLP